MPVSLCHRLIALLALVPLAICAIAAEEPLPAQFDFEQEALAPQWTTTACGAALSITRDGANVREGRGALELSWDATDGRLAILTIAPVRLDERARSLRLSVKLDQLSPVMFGVREADGSTYQGYMYTPGGVWHDLAVDLDELMLSEGSEDENGRLDVRQITGIVVADLSNISGEAGKSLGLKSGRPHLWLDNVEISAALAPHRSRRTPEGDLIIDDFEYEPIQCLPIGSPQLTLTGGPGDGDDSALRVGYDREHYRWVGFVAGVGHLSLADRSELCLRVRADNQVRLTVVLEERDGSKYVCKQRLEPERGWQTIVLPFGRFKLDPQTTDENEALDLDQLRVIIPVLDSKTSAVGTDGRGAWNVSRIWVR
jgi:hypothetical protein